MKLGAVLALVLVSQVALSESAYRGDQESFESAISRNQMADDDSPSAFTVAAQLSQLALTKIPTWKNSDIQEVFEKIRDERFLHDSSHPNSLRRSTWLYPQDGCFARSALAGRRAEKLGQVRPFQFFVFGDLEVKTANSAKGHVNWWYHVAPVVRDGWGTIWLLDPAIDPKGPMMLPDWVQAMGNPTNLKASVCQAKTYMPQVSCSEPSDTADSGALSDQLFYLNDEWQNLISLNRNPQKELGNSPPWLSGH